MPARPRKEIVDANSPGYYLVSQQVVRGLRLTGVDPYTGRDYTYRQEKLEQRIRDLACLYLVEVAEFSCGADGFQLLVRIRPDLVSTLSHEEVARRMLRRSEKQLALLPPPTDEAVEQAVSDVRRLNKMRERIANLSQFMGDIDEAMARDVNREARRGPTKLPVGRLWQGRFHSVKVLDEPALLLAAVHVEVQKVVDREAVDLVSIEYASAAIRAEDFDGWSPSTLSGLADPESRPPTETSRIEISQSETPRIEGRDAKASNEPTSADWLLSMERANAISAEGNSATFETGPYLQIGYRAFRRVLEWTLEAMASPSRDLAPAVAPDLQAVLDRFRVRVDVWFEAVRNFRQWFRTAVGCGDALKSYARQLGVAWLAGQGCRRHPFVE